MSAKIQYNTIQAFKYRLHQTYMHQLPFRGAKHYIKHECHGSAIELSPSGLLTIHAGWMWDGPSGPTLDQPWNMRGALVHDAIYALERACLLIWKYRELADREFYRVLKQDIKASYPAWRRWFYYMRARLYFRAVRVAAAGAAKCQPEPDDKVFTAP